MICPYFCDWYIGILERSAAFCLFFANNILVQDELKKLTMLFIEYETKTHVC